MDGESDIREHMKRGRMRLKRSENALVRMDLSEKNKLLYSLVKLIFIKTKIHVVPNNDRE